MTAIRPHETLPEDERVSRSLPLQAVRRTKEGETTRVAGEGASALTAYRARGVEPCGVVGDPLFVDAARGDFRLRLRPGSAAERIGFRE